MATGVIRLEIVLACSADAAWAGMHSAAMFRRVYAPVLVMRGDLPATFPDGLDAEVRTAGFGLVPLGRQRLRIRDDTGGDVRTMRDVGIPLTGPLRFITDWHHEMSVVPAGPDRCVWREELRVVSPLAWAYRPGLAILWAWRARRIRALFRGTMGA